MQVEAWQQETAAAISRRLLVASMACVTVWRLVCTAAIRRPKRLVTCWFGQRSPDGALFTVPALLAGLWALLAMLEALNEYTLPDLRTLTDAALAHLPPQPP